MSNFPLGTWIPRDTLLTLDNWRATMVGLLPLPPLQTILTGFSLHLEIRLCWSGKSNEIHPDLSQGFLSGHSWATLALCRTCSSVRMANLHSAPAGTQPCVCGTWALEHAQGSSLAMPRMFSPVPSALTTGRLSLVQETTSWRCPKIKSFFLKIHV